MWKKCILIHTLAVCCLGVCVAEQKGITMVSPCCSESLLYNQQSKLDLISCDLFSMANCGSRRVATFSMLKMRVLALWELCVGIIYFECTVAVRSFVLPQNLGKNVIVMQNWSCIFFWGDTCTYFLFFLILL